MLLLSDLPRVSLCFCFCFFFSFVEALSEDDANYGGGGIFWRDLSVSAGNTVLIHEFTGSVQRGQVCGIIGPSGSGKSTFLTALAGGGASSRLSVRGKVWQEKKDKKSQHEVPLSITNGQVAFLQQHDSFFHMLTPRETLDHAAFLEYPHYSKSIRDRLVARTMDSLGLSKVADRPIGDRSSSSSKSTSKGRLSGGERRRLSVGLELLSTPQLFLADECTTGLDSNQAFKTVQLIVRLAQERNIPALLTLHQPRAAVWKLLDDFILLAPGGRVCYHGARGDSALEYFEKLGYVCPEETNPAEFFIDLVSIDSEDPEQRQLDEERIDYLFQSFRKEQQQQQNRHDENKKISHHNFQEGNKHSSGRTGTDTSTSRLSFAPIPLVRRVGCLLRRSWRQNFRNKEYNLARLIASVGNALLFSQIFPSVRDGASLAKSVADRVALLSFGVINMSMMALMKTVHLFARERPVVDREQSRCQYSSWEYLLSKVIAEIPLDTSFAAIFTTVLKSTTGLRISWAHLTATFSLMTVAGASLGFAVGACAKDGDTAMATALPIMVLFMVVGIINPSGVDLTAAPPPLVVRWVKLASPMKWAIEGLAVAEYKGMDLRPKGHRPWQRIRDLPKFGALAFVQNGDQILEALGLEHTTYRGVMKHLAILSGLNLIVSWIGLRRNASFSKKPSKVGKRDTNQTQPQFQGSTVSTFDNVPVRRDGDVPLARKL